MSQLTIYTETDRHPTEVLSDGAEIGRRLETIGVRFERWEAAHALS